MSYIQSRQQIFFFEQLFEDSQKMMELSVKFKLISIQKCVIKFCCLNIISMKLSAMKENISKKTSREKIIQYIALSSHQVLDFSIENPLYVGLYFVMQRAFSTVLPLFILIHHYGIAPNHLNIIQFLDATTVPQIQIIQIFTLILCKLVLMGLVKLHQQCTYKSKFIPLMILFNALSPFLLLLNANFIRISDSHIFLTIIAAINLTLILVITTIVHFMLSSLSISNKNKLSARFSWPFFFNQVLQRLGCLFFPIFLPKQGQLMQDSAQNVWPLIFVIICFMRLMPMLVLEINSFTFYDEWVSFVHRFLICYQLGVSLISFLIMISKVDIIIDNFWVLSLSLFWFSALTLKRYIIYRDQQYYFTIPQQLKTAQQAIYFVKYIHQFVANGQEGTKFPNIFSKLKKDHEESCDEQQCQCKNLRVSKQFYLKLYSQSLNQILDKFSKNTDLSFLISFYKLDVLRIFADSSYFLKKTLHSNKASFTTQISCIKFQLKLQEFIRVKSEELKIVKTEKIYEADILIYNILQIWRQIISLRHDFWGFLHKQMVARQILLKNLDKQLQIQRNFEKITKMIMQDYSTNQILITQLVVYQKILLLKSHLDKQISEKINSLKNKSKRLIFSKNQMTHNAEIRKYMFGSQCCSIETKMNVQEAGIIVHASRNIQKIFGYTSKQIEGLNINKIMPHSMREEHDKILSNWMKSGSWSNIGAIRDIYGIKKNQYCFSLSIYLKVIAKKDSINLVATCFENNSKDFMIINDQGVIDGAGKNFVDILGHKIVGLPLDIINQVPCLSYSKQSKQARKRVISEFYSVEGLSKQIQDFLQFRYKINNSQSELYQKKRELCNTIYSSILPVRIQYDIIPYTMGSISFKIFRFVRSYGLSSIRMEHDQGIQKTLPQKNSKNFETDNEIDEKSLMEKNDEQQQFLNCGTSSMGRSLASDHYTIQNAVNKLEEEFLDPSKIYQKRAFKISSFIIILCVLMLFSSIGKLFINLNGYAEIQQLFFADGACSDNMQLLEFMYNKMMNLRMYRDRPEFQSILASAQFQRNYVQGLVSDEVKNMKQYTTSLIDKKFYIYQLDEVKWKLVNGEEAIITQGQFISALMGLSKNFMYKRANQLGNLTMQEQLFYVNFPQMKEINHYNLQKYLIMSDSTIFTIRTIGIIKWVISVLISIIIAFVLFRHYMFRIHQQKSLWMEFGLISRQNCLQLKVYYKSLLKSFEKKKEGKKKIEEGLEGIKEIQIEHQFTKFIQAQDNISIQNHTKSSSILRVMGSADKKWIIYLIAGIVLVFVLNITIYMWDNSILIVCQKMMVNINGLMDSENYILQAYFDLKSEFVLKDPAIQHNYVTIMPRDIQKFSYQLLTSMNQSEIIFNMVAAQSLQIFASYDPEYLRDMTNLLTDNLCKLEEEVLPDFLIQKCLTQMKLQVLQKGLVNSMNLFQRTVANSIYAMKKGEISKDDFFGVKFKQIDYSIFYMFKMYQGTQERITLSLKQTLQQHFQKVSALVYLQLICFIGLIIFSVSFYFRQRLKTANVNGYCSIIPIRILKCTKQMVKNLTHIADFQNRK